LVSDRIIIAATKTGIMQITGTPKLRRFSFDGRMGQMKRMAIVRKTIRTQK